ncbi:hypothetical protein CO123_03685 [bacterium (Candidatus Howlettbacteria) CG_4_9_14_3_um_filter_37_10]|nr:MAG: hypothetical protein CO123_03685 [bacterium (Candidatus Howlettbacteria) CG_4_9_14_3_um_filter_37_10]
MMNKKNFKKFVGKNRIFIILGSIYFAFFILFCVLSIIPHYNLHSNAADLGIFNQAIYNYSHFRLGPSTLRGYPSLLGDHFEILLIPVSALYYLFGTYTLLIVQLVAAIVGSFGVYLFIWRKTNDEILSVLASVFTLTFFGTWQALAFDYHLDAIAFAILPYLLLFLEKEKEKLYYIFLGAFLLAKESMAFVGIFLGLSILIFDKKKRKQGLITAVASFAYLLVVTKYLIPYFAGGTEYGYWYYLQLGADLPSAIVNLFKYPAIFIKLTFNEPAKIDLLKAILLSGGFLLIFNFRYLIIFLPFVLLKVYSIAPRMWGVQFQYMLVAGIILSIGIFLSLDYIKNKFESDHLKKAVYGFAMLIVLSSFWVTSGQYFYNGYKVSDLFSLNYYETGRGTIRKSFFDAKSKINSNDTVCCQSNLCPYLEDKKIYNLNEFRDAKCNTIILNKSFTRPNDIVLEFSKMEPADEMELYRKCRISPHCNWRTYYDRGDIGSGCYADKFKKMIDEMNSLGFRQVYSKDSIELYSKS